MLSEFEEGINRPSKSQTVLPHHEDTPAFQQQFTCDVKKVFENFSCNPFKQESLVKASNVNITYPECVHKALKTLLLKGESQFNEFWNFRLIRCETPIEHKITKNVSSISGRYEKNTEEVSISYNCADKAKIINRFLIDSFKGTFQSRTVRSVSNLNRAVS